MFADDTTVTKAGKRVFLLVFENFQLGNLF